MENYFETELKRLLKKTYDRECTVVNPLRGMLCLCNPNY